MSATVLYLVRHGSIGPLAPKSYIGQIDVPLSEEGVEQARALCKWLQPVRFNRILSSDLSRTQCTCRIIAGHLAHSMESLPALREIGLGAWEGCTHSEIMQRFPAEYAARGRDIENWRPPGGESFADCRARVLDAMHGVLDHAQGNILLVGHAGVNRLILCDVLGIPVAKLRSIGQDYGCLNIIDFSGAQSRLRLLNFIPPAGRTIAEIPSTGNLPALQKQEVY